MAFCHFFEWNRNYFYLDIYAVMKIVKVFHGKTGGGYLTQFYPYTGPVTYLAITQDGDGHFKFIVAEGVNEEGKILSFGDDKICGHALHAGLENL